MPDDAFQARSLPPSMAGTPARLRRRTVVLAGMAAALPSARAAVFPPGPLTLVVPFPPGGTSDTVARALQPALARKLGQAVTIDYAAGGAGAVGAQLVKNAAPDGLTLMVGSSGLFVTLPLLKPAVPYRTLRDFDLLTVAVRLPNVLAVDARLPVATVADFVAYVKRNPGKVAFSTAGAGGADHLSLALFFERTGISGKLIHGKGSAHSLSALVSGEASASMMNLNIALKPIRSGEVRALAISGSRRWFALPDVPTFSEAGVQNLELYSWQAVAVPKGVPLQAQLVLHKALVDSLNAPEVKARLLQDGLEVVGNSPEECVPYVQRETALWQGVVERAGVRLD